MTADDEGVEQGVGVLEEEARKRKDRLRALRNKLQGGGQDSDPAEVTVTVTGALPRPAFRSYNPQDEQFLETARPKAKPIDIEEQISDTLEQGEVKTLLEDVELTNLAPRKPDWDLKRDIAPKLQKVERRTQKAIAELILERLQTHQEDLAGAVQLSNPGQFAGQDED